MKKDIEPRNHKNQRHGLWINYYTKGHYINGIRHGYFIEFWVIMKRKTNITFYLK